MPALATAQMTDALAASELRRAAAAFAEGERIIDRVRAGSLEAREALDDIAPHGRATAYAIGLCAEELESAVAEPRRAAA